MLHGDFVLPARDWWEYYRPIEARMAELRKHPHSPELARVMDNHEEEMALYREEGAVSAANAQRVAEWLAAHPPAVR